jgi:hypothetical protein
MRRIAVLGCLIAAAGCGYGQDQEAPATEMSEAEAPAASPLADFAGTWNMRALTEAGDSVLVEYEMVATDGTEGWTVTFPDREPIPAHIHEAAGDSVVIHLGPYPSALRDAVDVSTVTVSRIVNSRMVGYFTATYDTEGEDQILNGLQEGERIR